MAGQSPCPPDLSPRPALPTRTQASWFHPWWTHISVDSGLGVIWPLSLGPGISASSFPPQGEPGPPGDPGLTVGVTWGRTSVLLLPKLETKSSGAGGGQQGKVSGGGQRARSEGKLGWGRSQGKVGGGRRAAARLAGTGPDQPPPVGWNVPGPPGQDLAVEAPLGRGGPALPCLTRALQECDVMTYVRETCGCCGEHRPRWGRGHAPGGGRAGPGHRRVPHVRPALGSEASLPGAPC